MTIDKNKVDLEKLDFETALSELEKIVEKLGSQKVNLEEMVSLYQKAQILKDYCSKRALYYKSKDKEDEIVDLLLQVPGNVSHTLEWWRMKNLYSREMLKKKKYKISYDLVKNHGLKSGTKDFAEAEWLAGWIALRFLKNPEVAYDHFSNLYFNVSYPISISRAAYWLGMASESMEDRDKAIDWYKVASKYPTYFYGQIAIHKYRKLDSIGSKGGIVLPKAPEIEKSDIESVSKLMSVKIAYTLALMNHMQDALYIFKYAINNTETAGEVGVIMELVNEVGNRELQAKLSRHAAKKSVFFIRDKFQILKEVGEGKYSALVHAIIKQESGFAVSATSSVGATGFMQLMPDTAKHVAKKMGVKYNQYELSNNIEYNISLGSYYIKSLVDQFDGSELLAIAAYNAGPHNAKRWVKEFYDPREEEDIDKVIDWIELITYSETRNYVQRIMENLIVYKYLMSRTNYDDIK